MHIIPSVSAISSFAFCLADLRVIGASGEVTEDPQVLKGSLIFHPPAYVVPSALNDFPSLDF